MTTITSKDLALHSNGIPPGEVPQFTKVARAAIKAGCSIMQARCIAKLAYSAAHGFDWNIPQDASGLKIHSARKISPAGQ